MKRHMRTHADAAAASVTAAILRGAKRHRGKNTFVGSGAPICCSEADLRRNLMYLRCDLRAAFEQQTGKPGKKYVEGRSYPSGVARDFEARMDALREPWMVWEDYWNTWCARWVRPPSDFDLSDSTQRWRCFSFNNMSPQRLYPRSRIVYGNGFLSD